MSDDTAMAQPAGPQESLSGVASPLRPFFNAMPVAAQPHVFGSTLCRAEHFLLPLFRFWLNELQMHPSMHRKLWELVFITQTLHELDKMQPGCRGLGFGVGQEPLSAYFAKRGVEVVATDLEITAAQQAGWADSGQHATTADTLFWPGIVDRAIFDQRVTFQNADMNDIPSNLREFDFCWSACALEHTGSIDQGLAFIENSLTTLKKGGVAVHTTEFNMSSDDDTIEAGGTVLFRKQDIRVLQRLLAIRGHRMLPLNLYPGATEIDAYVDVPPYGNDPHLRLQVASWKSTSIGLAIVKG